MKRAANARRYCVSAAKTLAAVSAGVPVELSEGAMAMEAMLTAMTTSHSAPANLAVVAGESGESGDIGTG